MVCYKPEHGERFEIIYDGSCDKLASEFYIPVLKRTGEYWRVSGYFSVDSLAIISTSLAGLIKMAVG